MRALLQRPTAPASGVHRLACPVCGDPALLDDGPTAACAACGARFETVTDATVVRARMRRRGNCCSGMKRFDVTYEGGDGRGCARFETWVQHPIVLRPGDRFTLLFEPGERQRRHPMARWVVNHTLVEAWPVP